MREGEEKRGKEMREGREEATHSFRGKIEWPFVQPSTHPTSFFRLNTLKMNKTVWERGRRGRERNGARSFFTYVRPKPRALLSFFFYLSTTVQLSALFMHALNFPLVKFSSVISWLEISSTPEKGGGGIWTARACVCVRFRDKLRRSSRMAHP